MTSSTLEDTYHDYCRATESGIGYSNCVTSGQGLNLSGPVSFSEMKIRNTLQRSQECLQCHTWLFHTTGSVCALLGLTWDHTISPSFLFRETNLSGFVNIQPKGQQRELHLTKWRQIGPDILKAYLYLDCHVSSPELTAIKRWWKHTSFRRHSPCDCGQGNSCTRHVCENFISRLSFGHNTFLGF